jgi:hypothetical protein
MLPRGGAVQWLTAEQNESQRRLAQERCMPWLSDAVALGLCQAAKASILGLLQQDSQVLQHAGVDPGGAALVLAGAAEAWATVMDAAYLHQRLVEEAATLAQVQARRAALEAGLGRAYGFIAAAYRWQSRGLPLPPAWMLRQALGLPRSDDAPLQLPWVQPQIEVQEVQEVREVQPQVDVPEVREEASAATEQAPAAANSGGEARGGRRARGRRLLVWGAAALAAGAAVVLGSAVRSRRR